MLLAEALPEVALGNGCHVVEPEFLEGIGPCLAYAALFILGACNTDQELDEFEADELLIGVVWLILGFEVRSDEETVYCALFELAIDEFGATGETGEVVHGDRGELTLAGKDKVNSLDVKESLFDSHHQRVEVPLVSHHSVDLPPLGIVLEALPDHIVIVVLPCIEETQFLLKFSNDHVLFNVLAIVEYLLFAEVGSDFRRIPIVGLK